MLAKVKAELRAHVFEAVQQKDGAGANPRRSVSDLPRGALMASLVAESLEWSGCDYAARVFAAEIGEVDVRSNASRDALARELGLRDAAPDAPLLHALLGRSRPEIPGAGVGQKTPATAGSTAVPPLPSLAAIKRPVTDRGAVTMSDDDESAEIEEDISVAASDGFSAGGRSPRGGGGGVGLSPREGPMPAGTFDAADVSGSIDGMDETVDVVEGVEGGVGDADGGRPKTAKGGRRR